MTVPMMSVLFGFVYGIADVSIDPLSKLYFNTDDGSVSYQIPLPDFSDKEFWHFHDNARVENGVLIMDTNGRAAYANLNGLTLPDGNFTHFYNECPTDSSGNTNGICYIDLHTPNGALNGANANTMYKKTYSLKEPISGGAKISIGIHFNGEGARRFKVPILKFIKKTPKEFSSLHSTAINEDATKYTADIKKDEKFVLQSLGLKDAFSIPDYVMKSVSIYGSSYSFSMMPIIANATHIVGIDVDDTSFFAPWQMNRYKTYNLFIMPIKAREDFSISIIIYKISNENYLDALDHWYDLFPHIYKEQPNGAGAWLPNPNLNTLFANNNDEIDVFLGSFLWGTGTWNKISVPNYKYTETTMYRIPIEYSSDYEQMKKNLQECVSTTTKKDPEEIKEECQIALKHAIRNRYNKFTFYSDSDWYSSGSRYINTWTQELYERRMEQDIYKNYNDSKNWFVGIGLDSFSNFHADYEFSDHIPAQGVTPISLLESEGETPFQTMMSGFFAMFKNEKWTVKRGYAFNSNAIAPQLAKYVGSIGWEIGLTNYGRNMNNFKAYRPNFWGIRYAIGSRAMSMLENQNKGTLSKFAEDMFAVFTSVGITPSSQPINGPSMWVDPEQNNEMRKYYLRWGPTLRKSLNHTVFKANNNGAKVTVPVDKKLNYPNISNNDFYSLSTFCNESTGLCWTHAFIAYLAQNTNKEKHIRTIIISSLKNPKCVFVAKEASCHVKGNNVTVSVKWSSTDPIYRVATIESNSSKSLSNGAISAIVIISLIVVLVAVFIIAVFIKKKE